MAETPTGRPPRSNLLLKIVVALGVLAGVGFLFIRSVRSTRSEPYTIKGEHLRGWTVALEPAPGPTAPMLVLEPPPDLPRAVFHQIFARAMESLNAPTSGGIPLVLQGEFDRVFAGRVTPDALVAAAHTAGLGSAAMEARCLAYRRISEPGSTRQVYFVLFNAPAFTRFREQIGTLVDRAASGADFDPAALSPVLFVAASDPGFNRWLPLRADPGADCVAPIAIE